MDDIRSTSGLFNTTMSSKGVAVVTGSAQGIGRAIALRLAEDGYDLAINDIANNQQNLESLAKEIESKGRKATTVLADVSQEEEVKKILDHVIEHHGGVNVFVANAGIAGPAGGGFATVDGETFDRVMNINARSTFLCYKYAGQQMIKQGGGGRIIGASSVAGKKAIATQAVYSASKAAIRALTQAAAQEFGPSGITVNAYAPGAINTTMLTGGFEQADAIIGHFKSLSPLGIVGEPQDIAGLVSYLASDESRFITGQSISINGGLFFD
ncbi:NAD(P)-binding protein [Mycena indigotica]|uniref:NAD(P)-binding protein n=1 Tax=Mycena indigotica TaxID=2126181 RepID=A0A8H6W6X4_9AGAR|nr:NAD(P)-binding protein [Mycena indigotica]KAF7303858.1 NAD(P)-binding protein [Mycena indigotica]